MLAPMVVLAAITRGHRRSRRPRSRRSSATRASGPASLLADARIVGGRSLGIGVGLVGLRPARRGRQHRASASSASASSYDVARAEALLRPRLRRASSSRPYMRLADAARRASTARVIDGVVNGVGRGWVARSPTARRGVRRRRHRRRRQRARGGASQARRLGAAARSRPAASRRYQRLVARRARRAAVLVHLRRGEGGLGGADPHRVPAAGRRRPSARCCPASRPELAAVGRRGGHRGRPGARRVADRALRARRRACSSSSGRRGSRRPTSSYHLGVDGISLPMLVPLGAADVPRGARVSWKIEKKPAFYFAMLLLLEVGHERRLRGARLRAVLRVLGARARPDVLPHRAVGRAAARVRVDQVLPLHAVRLGVHARRHHRALPRTTRRRSTWSRSPARAGCSRRRSSGGCSCVLPRLRGQGADLAAAHVAARRARRGARRPRRCCSPACC